MVREKQQTLQTVPGGDGGWFPLLRDSFAGAWQRNLEIDQSTALSYYAIFSCITLIASDICKLRVKLVQLDNDGIWAETTNPAYSPVLNTPNPIQNRIQFWENWILSKLIRGNTYVLKVRDNRTVVSDLFVLNPYRVTPLISEDGQVFYRLQQDNIAGIGDVTVPASEIIHDRWNCIFHPLVGISPMYSNNLAATHGMRIQQNSVAFFGNASNPGGILTAPDHIPREEAEEMKDRWEENFGGNNVGRVAVLGNGLSFQKIAITAVDAQLIEQGRWTAEIVCATFHVPPYKIGIGEPPKYNNIQALNVEYYSQCLQTLIESAELCLDEGLGLGTTLGVEFDIENLLRMDSLLLADFVTKLTSGGVLEINEARKKFNLGKTQGGDTAYLQQQNYSLAALNKRDTSADPFLTARVSETVRPTGVEQPIDVPQLENEPKTSTPSTPPVPPAKSIQEDAKRQIINDIAARQLSRYLSNANNVRI
jgi:HK97 family phage portal protein